MPGAAPIEIAAESPAAPEGLVELVLLDREVVEAAEVGVVRADLEAGLHHGQVEPVRGGVDDGVGAGERGAQARGALARRAHLDVRVGRCDLVRARGVAVDEDHALDALARRGVGGRDPAHASCPADHRNAHRASVAMPGAAGSHVGAKRSAGKRGSTWPS